MSTCKRYDPERLTDDYGPYCNMRESSAGDWVKFSDIPRIKAQAIRDAAVYLESQTQTSKTDYVLLNEYADKLERDE